MTELLAPQYLTIAGTRVVVLSAADYQNLARRADVWEPPMPVADEEGRYPADVAMAVSLARDILRARRKLGLSQAELATLAGVPLKKLDQIERAESQPRVSVIDKIEAALSNAKRKSIARAKGDDPIT